MALKKSDRLWQELSSRLERSDRELRLLIRGGASDAVWTLAEFEQWTRTYVLPQASYTIDLADASQRSHGIDLIVRFLSPPENELQFEFS